MATTFSLNLAYKLKNANGSNGVNWKNRFSVGKTDRIRKEKGAVKNRKRSAESLFPNSRWRTVARIEQLLSHTCCKRISVEWGL